MLNLATRTLGPPLASIPPNHALPGTRFNDGLASPQGTWVGGRLHKDWREGRRGRVYALVFGDGAETEGARPDAAAPPRAASLVPVLEESEVGMANGMAWGDGGAAFYLADSASKCVLRFEADPASGIPRSGTGRVVVSASTLGGAVPDGLCLDDAGRLWVALAETGAVGVFEPGEGGGGGREVGRVQGLPLTRLTSVAWGKGEEAGSLIVTSREEKGEGASPVAGCVCVVLGTGGRGAGGGEGVGVVRLPAASS